MHTRSLTAQAISANSLRYEFTSTALTRNRFLESFTHAVIGFYGYDNGFLIFLREIVKNIYDHADGCGYCLMVKKDDGSISFEIRNQTPQSFDLELIKRSGSSKAGNDINYGFGVCGGGIDAFAKALGIALTLDATQGFLYIGEYRPKHRPDATA